MDAQIAKWGNSLAVRIPKAVAERAHLREGERLEMSVNEDGAVVLRPARPAIGWRICWPLSPTRTCTPKPNGASLRDESVNEFRHE